MMIKVVRLGITLIFVVGIISVSAEPPVGGDAGARIDPALLARVKGILFSGTRSSSNNPSSQQSQGSAPAYGAPSGGNGAAPAQAFGGFDNSPAALLDDVTLFDPVPIPLLSTFDLPPTVEKRINYN